MFQPPFCPYQHCTVHTKPPDLKWWQHYGYHWSKVHGSVPRFLCKHCGHTFSVQTFSVHFYTKRIIELADLERRVSSSMSIRALSRDFRCTEDTILNRLDRIARQGIALHCSLRPKADPTERLCFDGLVSFDRSQYHPNDIGISITAGSRFVLGLSHASTRRSGRMTPYQKEQRNRIDKLAVYENHAIERSLTEHLDMIQLERPHSAIHPLILSTDEKHDYVRAVMRHALYREQDNEHRMIHQRVPSTYARTQANPLSASNYYDREVRKDQAHHRRETVCFARDAATGMSRLYVHMVYHNYEKHYRINQPDRVTKTAAEVAGIPGTDIRLLRKQFFTQRAFLSLLKLKALDLKIWIKEVWDPIKGGLKHSYIPRFAFA